MILFFRSQEGSVVAVKTSGELSQENLESLKWLLGGAELAEGERIEGTFTGPREGR